MPEERFTIRGVDILPRLPYGGTPFLYETRQERPVVQIGVAERVREAVLESLQEEEKNSVLE